jgi:prolyl-tRNA editing enzyme YbaK/EbsC (Cys-tRNA(Pro) deacylase)
MAIYCEKGIVELPRIYINGGARGVLVGLEPRELVRVLQPVLVEVATG